MFVTVRKRFYNQGFTLVEVVVGILAMAVALVFMTGVMFPQAERGTDPWFQVRSAELAQSFMNEVLARSFDENSPRSGQLLRCDEDPQNLCIADLPSDCPADQPWVEEANRELYDDVDDFHCLSLSGDELVSIDGESLGDAYNGFTIGVQVQYAGEELGLNDDRLAKRILVRVTPPRGSAIDYTSYKANY